MCVENSRLRCQCWSTARHVRSAATHLIDIDKRRSCRPSFSLRDCLLTSRTGGILRDRLPQRSCKGQRGEFNTSIPFSLIYIPVLRECGPGKRTDRAAGGNKRGQKRDSNKNERPPILHPHPRGCLSKVRIYITPSSFAALFPVSLVLSIPRTPN